MKVCNKCGTWNNESSDYCSHCGHKISNSTDDFNLGNAIFIILQVLSVLLFVYTLWKAQHYFEYPMFLFLYLVVLGIVGTLAVLKKYKLLIVVSLSIAILTPIPYLFLKGDGDPYLFVEFTLFSSFLYSLFGYIRQRINSK